MARQEVHFEIFIRQGAKGGWKLHDVVEQRDLAIAVAQEMMAEERATGVKIIKETYSPETGDYLTLKIYEDGHNKFQSDPKAEDVPSAMLCFKPDDLYSYHARATLSRLLIDFLTRQKLTVTELIHRSDALEKFEATGTLYQHAVQKIAVAQASSTKKPVQQIMKELNDLATKAINRVYRDERRKYFPEVEAGSFAALADRLTGEADGGYVLNGAIAKHLRSAQGWEEKLVRLLAIMEECSGDSASAQLLLASVDTIAAEILTGSAALHELIGSHENLGDALSTLTHLFLGQMRPDASPSQGVLSLTRRFADDQLQSARTAIANRIMAELKSPKKLGGETLLDEIAILRRLANKLVLGQGKYLSHEDLIAAFTMRSKRLVTYETLARFLEPIIDPDEKVESLLKVEEGVIGAENKRQIAAAVLPIVSSAAFVNQFQANAPPALTRLQRLMALQTSVLRSGMQENQKQEIAHALDKLASEVELRAKVMASIDRKPVSHVEKVMALLDLYTCAALTEGSLSAKGREIVLAYLAKPGFLTEYVAHVTREGTQAPADAIKAEFIQMLEKAGITPASGLRLVAA